MADVLVRCAVEVVAGILPGTPDENVAPKRRWLITSRDWNSADDTGKAMLLSDVAGQANGWAQYLMLQPNQLNWVQTSWVWF